MEAFYLVKIGEILLKLGNRKEFEERLKSQIKRRFSLAGVSHKVEVFPGRYSVPEGDADAADFILSRMPGINGYVRAIKTEKTPDAVFSAAIDIAREQVAAGKRRFKAESRRSDKSFPLGSFELSAEIGSRVLSAFPETRVDLHDPDFTINVEVRERAYVYPDPRPGVRGLPVGSGGMGLLLLSGGIDSPVAGYMMARRGLALEALYFHAYPYTSQEAYEKVASLARVVGGYTGGTTLWTVPFTDIQLKIKKNARMDTTTIMMRAAMMRVAQLHAENTGANCIVTGESLGQVASQTAENMRFIQSFTDFPVMRPLAGMDKEDTIRLAKLIGSYDISILPYEDCCVLFSPAHPLIKANVARETASFAALELEDLIIEALEKTERREIPFEVPR
jgi:thiamine biosynthesis protein ThiI